jgi:hypothetical protein
LEQRHAVRCYFAYGSNMNVARMTGRDMNFTSVVAGCIQGFGLRFNKRSRRDNNLACANIVYSPSERLEGLLYKLDGVDEIAKLDVHEGSPRRYSREVFAVDTANGVEYAWIYVANPAVIDNQIKPARWYVEHLLAGREYLSDEYWRGIDLVECGAHGVEWS